MTDIEGTRIHSAIEKLLKVAPNQRTEWLERTFPGDSVLRRRLLAAVGDDEEQRDVEERCEIGFAVSDQSPDTIDKFQILQPLGEGGMGRLYLGRDPDIGRLVAIKLLREGFTSQEHRERFIREAKSASLLRHANIVTIFQTGTHQGHPFIVMEYIQGETLADMIDRRIALSLERKLQLMDEIAAGLQYAHRKGVVHRDVKPANIMLDEDGVLRILDFGIARFGGAGLTQAGAIMGTLNYMAPEQLAGLPVDARADMFSAGAVYYELLSYRRAFPGGFPTVLQKIAVDPPEPLERLEPWLDTDLIAVVNRCLAKRAEDRYPDFVAVRQALAAVGRRLAAAVGETTIVAPALRFVADSGELSHIHADQLRQHIEDARRAINDANYDRALQASHAALVLDPECAEALDLESRARTALQGQQLIARWLSDARSALDVGDATAASILVDRALSLSSDSPEALAVRRAVDELRRRWAEAHAVSAVADPATTVTAVAQAKAVRIEQTSVTVEPRRPRPIRPDAASPMLSWRAVAVAAVVITAGAAAVWLLPRSVNPSAVPIVGPDQSSISTSGLADGDRVVTARVAAFISAARDGWQQGELNAALGSVSAALSLQPEDPEARALITEFIRQARERSTRAAAEARARQAAGAPMYLEAISRENDGVRLQDLGQPVEAATAFVDAAALFARASAGLAPAPSPAPPSAAPNDRPLTSRADLPPARGGTGILLAEAEALRLRRDYDAAIARYMETLRIDPLNERARAGLQETQAAKQRAEQVLEKLAGSLPGPPTAASPAETEAQRFVGLAIKAMDTGDDAAALKALDEALRLNPRNESAQKLLKVLTGR